MVAGMLDEFEDCTALPAANPLYVTPDGNTSLIDCTVESKFEVLVIVTV